MRIMLLTVLVAIRELLLRVLHTIEIRLRTDCRHVLARGMLAEGPVIVRCCEPSFDDCSVGYCEAHCNEVCGCANDDDGDDGDEDEVEPYWEPSKDEAGREKVEA